jgi:hypothetical protein
VRWHPTDDEDARGANQGYGAGPLNITEQTIAAQSPGNGYQVSSGIMGVVSSISIGAVGSLNESRFASDQARGFRRPSVPSGQ